MEGRGGGGGAAETNVLIQIQLINFLQLDSCRLYHPIHADVKRYYYTCMIGISPFLRAVLYSLNDRTGIDHIKGCH